MLVTSIFSIIKMLSPLPKANFIFLVTFLCVFKYIHFFARLNCSRQKVELGVVLYYYTTNYENIFLKFCPYIIGSENTISGSKEFQNSYLSSCHFVLVLVRQRRMFHLPCPNFYKEGQVDSLDFAFHHCLSIHYSLENCCPSSVCPHLFLPGLVRSITPTFTYGIQYDLVQLFSIMCRCVISNICSNMSKVKVTFDDSRSNVKVCET